MGERCVTDKSVPVEPIRTRGTLPRWALELWLWSTVPAALLDYTGCPWEGARRFCMAFSNDFAAYLFTFVPGATLALFAGLGAKLPVAFLLAAGVTLACHLAMRRLLAPRVRLWVVAALYASMLLLTFGVDLLWAGQVLHHSPWRLPGR